MTAVTRMTSHAAGRMPRIAGSPAHAAGRTSRVDSASSSSTSERGAITVEFAVAMPVAVLVLGMAVATLAAAAGLVGAQGSAAAIVRADGRGDAAEADALARSLAPGAARRTTHSSGLVCERLERRVRVLAVPVPVVVTACAPDGGR